MTNLDRRLADSSLTLFNEYGETYDAGALSTFKKTAAKLQMRWTCDDKMENTSPFTHALVHTDRRTLKVVAIKPFEPGTDPKEIELEFSL